MTIQPAIPVFFRHTRRLSSGAFIQLLAHAIGQQLYSSTRKGTAMAVIASESRLISGTVRWQIYGLWDPLYLSTAIMSL